MQVLTNCQSLYLHQYEVRYTQALLISLHVPTFLPFELSTAASGFSSSLGFGNWDLFFSYTKALFF
jgi:hypothetical protein